MAPELASSIPEGNYKVVSIALDLTGKKLIDEIWHIASYSDSNDTTFSQYVMPHRDISRSASRTYGIKIFCNLGKYRALKDTLNSKTLKTKSAYSALIDWIDWLKEAKGSTDGVIVAYHDNNSRNVTPFLLDALERYKLTDDFFLIVKGFVSCYEVASAQPDMKNRALTLHALSKRLLEEDVKDGEKNSKLQLQNAKDRSELTYKVLKKLISAENEVLSSVDLLKYCTNRSQEMENLEKQRELALKVKSLRPIFVSKIRKNPKERSRAVLLRRYLIEISLDYETLQKAYESGAKEAIIELVETTSAKRKKQDMDELVEIVFQHFKNGGKKDVNHNDVKNRRVGEGEPTGASVHDMASSSESEDDEFEEAKDEEPVEVGN